MILLRGLTKLEEEKLIALKEEIVKGFRKRVTPMMRWADGTKTPIKYNAKKYPYQVTTLRTLSLGANQRRDMVRAARSVEFLQSMIRGAAGLVGLPRDIAEAMVTMRAGASIRAGESVVRRGALVYPSESFCSCANCAGLRGDRGFGDSTVARLPAPVIDLDEREEMHPQVQDSGPPRRSPRRYTSIGGFGSIMETEPGEDRTFRKPGNTFLMSALENADRNREMQYDERTWEI